MAWAIPKPKRSIRSIIVLVLLLAIPYLILERITTSRDAGRRLDERSGGTARRTRDEWWPGEDDDLDDGIGGGELVLQSPDLQMIEDDERSYVVDEEDGLGLDLKNNKAKFSTSSSGASHTFLPSGLLLPNPEAQHPIYALIQRAKSTWEGKQRKASTTLAEAVNEYRRRYERAPPKGFDRWWAYVRQHGVGLPDEYDQIHRDLEPFHAITPFELQSLLSNASAHSGMYTISCPGTRERSSDPKARTKERFWRPNKSKLYHPLAHRCTYAIVETGLNEEGLRVAIERAEAQISLLHGVEELLEEVQVVFYSHDVPWQFVGHEYVSRRSRMSSLVLNDGLSRKAHWKMQQQSESVDTAHLGWASACAPHKPLRETYDVDSLPDVESLWAGSKSFIWDHKASMDPCVHPTLTHLVGFLSGHGKGPRPSEEIFPVLAMCKTTLHADVLAVSMEAWTEDVGDDPEWEDKMDDRLLWRGKTTGIYFKDGVPWNISQRINLVSRAAQTTGDLPILSVPSAGEPVGEAKHISISQLNQELLDVAFVDQAIQCDEDVCEEIQKNYEFGERKSWSQGNDYKYLLDIDGNGWSARFKRLMSTNSVVLKSTIFPEWYTDRIQPWLHYIPIKADLTDLYDVLSFFRAGAEHDLLAREIAYAGREWSKRYWRKEDMVAYQFRLFLEYARLMDPDRERASFYLRGDELK